MKKSEELFYFIKSLTPTEKRYFRLQSSAHVKGDKNNYLKIFEAIDEQKKYDQAALMERLKKEGISKHFAYAKNYLFRAILSTMGNYHSGSTLTGRTAERMLNVEILMSKGFGDKALKQISDIKKDVADHQDYELLLKVLALEYTLYRRVNFSSVSSKDKRSYDKAYGQVLEVLKLKHETKLLMEQILDLYFNATYIRNEKERAVYDKIVQDPAFKTKVGKSFWSESHRLSTFGIYHTISGNIKKALEMDKEHFKLLHAYPEIVRENVRNYTTCGFNLMYSYRELGEFNKMQDVLHQMKSQRTEAALKKRLSPLDEANFFCTCDLMGIVYLVASGQLNKAAKEAEVMKGKLFKYKGFIESHQFVEIGNTLAQALHFNKRYEDALELLNTMIDYAKREKIFLREAESRLLKVMLYYDLGPGYHNMLAYDLKSLKRFLVKHDLLSDASKSLIVALTALIKKKTPPKEVWQMLMEETDKRNNSESETAQESISHIKAWAMSHYSKKSIATCLKQTRDES